MKAGPLRGGGTFSLLVEALGLLEQEGKETWSPGELEEGGPGVVGSQGLIKRQYALAQRYVRER